MSNKKKFLMLIIAISLSVVFLNACSLKKKTDNVPNTKLTGRVLVHCASGMRKPVSKLVKGFQDSTGIIVEISYDGTNRLLGQIDLTRKGDIYIAGDADYVEIAKQKGLVEKSGTMCWFVPVILVAKGNPKKITDLNSLTRDGVRFGIGDEKSAAVGRITPDIFKAHSIDRAGWEHNVVLSTPTVHELGNAIKLGTIDATIIWNATAIDYKDEGDVISIDPEKNVIPEVGIAVLTCSSNKVATDALYSFLLNEPSKKYLSEIGYSTTKP